MQPSSCAASDRLRLIASAEALARIGAEVDDLADADIRAEAIRADHPELEEALEGGLDEVVIPGEIGTTEPTGRATQVRRRTM
jgi:hypothetical protein